MKLEDINKENPFIVPDNYFDTFYSNLEIRMNVKKTKYLRPLLAIAASIILTFLVLKPLNVADSFVDNTNLSNINMITETELEDYLSLSYSDYEIYLEITQ